MLQQQNRSKNSCSSNSNSNSSSDSSSTSTSNSSSSSNSTSNCRRNSSSGNSSNSSSSHGNLAVTLQKAHLWFGRPAAAAAEPSSSGSSSLKSQPRQWATGKPKEQQQATLTAVATAAATRARAAREPQHQESSSSKGAAAARAAAATAAKEDRLLLRQQQQQQGQLERLQQAQELNAAAGAAAAAAHSFDCKGGINVFEFSLESFAPNHSRGGLRLSRLMGEYAPVALLLLLLLLLVMVMLTSLLLPVSLRLRELRQPGGPPRGLPPPGAPPDVVFCGSSSGTGRWGCGSSNSSSSCYCCCCMKKARLRRVMLFSICHFARKAGTAQKPLKSCDFQQQQQRLEDVGPRPAAPAAAASERFGPSELQLHTSLASMAEARQLKCRRPGCGGSFDPSDNKEDSCRHHREAWDWDSFMKLQGESSSNSSSKSSSNSSSKRSSNSGSRNRRQIEEHLQQSSLHQGLLLLQIHFLLFQQQRQQQRQRQQQQQQNIAEALRRLGYNFVGRTHAATGAQQQEQLQRQSSNHNRSSSSSNSSSSSSDCVLGYHPGEPTFRNGCKSWSCCGGKALEWEEFLKLPPCKQGMRLLNLPPLASAAAAAYVFFVGSAVVEHAIEGLA
ncbi:hypothetical protein Esti_006604 [Eimeria stiedai]